MIETFEAAPEEEGLLTWEEVYKQPGVYQNQYRKDAYLVISSIFTDIEATAPPIEGVINGAIWVTTYVPRLPGTHIQPIRGGHQPEKRCWKKCDHLQLYIGLKSEGPIVHKVESNDGG